VSEAVWEPLSVPTLLMPPLSMPLSMPLARCPARRSVTQRLAPPVALESRTEAS
jgi:hypothetical protein